MIYLPKTIPQWLLLSGVVLWTAAVLLDVGGAKPESRSQTMGEAEALVACQSAIRRAAYDPEKASVPAVSGVLAIGHYRFEWKQSTSMVRLRNRLGLDAAVTASCAVEPTSRRFLHLVVDDRPVL